MREKSQLQGGLDNEQAQEWRPQVWLAGITGEFSREPGGTRQGHHDLRH